LFRGVRQGAGQTIATDREHDATGLWQQADEQFDESLGGGVPLAQIKRRDCAIIRGHLDHEQLFRGG
jgi:hypothetical protein